MRLPLFSPSRRSFTLIELLVVIAIIAILSALAVGASQYVMQKAGVSRAQTEIAAMAAALERYKTDNGDYPVTAPIAASPEYVGTPSSYQANAAVLYASLAGTATYGSAPTNTVYIKFASNQVATNATPQYVKDPFRNAYGFQTAVTSDPSTPNTVVHNAGFVDLWSTANQTTSTNFNQWVTNWKN